MCISPEEGVIWQENVQSAVYWEELLLEDMEDILHLLQLDHLEVIKLDTCILGHMPTSGIIYSTHHLIDHIMLYLKGPFWSLQYLLGSSSIFTELSYIGAAVQHHSIKFPQCSEETLIRMRVEAETVLASVIDAKITPINSAANHHAHKLRIKTFRND